MSPLLIRILQALAGLVFIGLAVYLAQKLLSPFFAAAILAIILEPFVAFIESRGISRKKSVVAVLFLLLLVSNVLIFVVCTRMVAEIVELVKVIPHYTERLGIYFDRIIIKANEIFNNLPEEYSHMLVAGLREYSGRVVEFLVLVHSRIISGILDIPSMLIWLLILFISLYFMLVDKEKILRQIGRFLPSTVSKGLTERGQVLKEKSLNILKVYLILVAFTTLQAILGLAILGKDYALLIGIAVGFLDLIPFIGPGFIFIPWVVLSFSKGEFIDAIALVILYAMLIISREILEAKMISGRLGLHPLLGMVAMYLGFELMGVAGIVIGPVVFLIVKEFLGLEDLKCF